MTTSPAFAPDVHSFAQPDVAVVNHLELNLVVNFEEKIIQGVATYTFIAQPDATHLILDSHSLEIDNIELDSGTRASFRLGPEKPFLGQALMIDLLPDSKKVSIWYRTSPGAAALQWLNPEQTGSKKFPFLFTQSQAILARTWLPCQDSPGIRFTYWAQVRVPANFIALMSAENPQVKNSDGLYTFNQDKPIPSYLMALAVGDLTFAPLNDRTGIYAEPDQLQAAAQEFAQLPAMLNKAEELYGNYLWGRYDLLLLPPSFPFGGMENPMLTFVTPTILTGDQSLTSLVAHELAHSWSGNLVTNATWNDFWLNEGFTVYFERRIMEALYGQDYADMLKVLGYQDLQHTLQEIGTTSPDTHLKLNLLNRDPDEGLTEIAYEKGNLFLCALEEAYGREAFDKFVINYFQDYAFRAMDTETFLSYLKDKLLGQTLIHPNKKVISENWIYAPGLPDARPEFTSALFNQVTAVAQQWEINPDAGILPAQQWSTHEWLYFLHLVESGLTQEKMQELDNAFKLNQSGNTEIVTVWFRNALKVGYEPAYPALEEFLLRVGRRKFILPLYKAMRDADPAWAAKVYQRARPNYHAVATGSLDNLFKAVAI